MIKHFLKLFYKPAAEINAILKEQISFKRIVAFLFWIGLLRACLETIWLYLKAGRPPELTIEFWPFLIGNIFTAYFRWAMFALIVFLAGRFVGGRGKFADILRIYGIVLGSYALSPVINALHLVFNIPFISFGISKALVHSIGIGQIVLSAWSVWIAYLIAKQLHKTAKFASLLIGLLVPVFDRSAFIFSSIAYFSMPFINMFTPKAVSNIATFLFFILSVVMIPVFIWLGFKIDRVKG